MESHSAYSNIEQPGHRLIMDAQQWADLWAELRRPAPTGADFKKYFAVAAFAGSRNSGGYGIVFEPPRVENGVMVVRYVVTRPKGMATMALTQPYAVKFFPKTSKPVKVEGRDE